MALQTSALYFTITVIMFCAVVNGSYCQIPLPVIFRYTTSPSETLCSIFKVMSAVQKLLAILALCFQTHKGCLERDLESETAGAEPCCSSVLNTSLVL